MCDERERLIGYVYEECDAEERSRIDDHLETCATCRREISGLRSVRQDLLAWAVPDHDPIWRPTVPPVAWWRQVPAWAAVAAATVMFVLGAAGGVLTHSVLPEQSAPVTAAVPAVQAPVAVTPAVVTPVELSATEQRILQLLRSELDARRDTMPAGLQPVRFVNASADSDRLLRRVNELNSESEARLIELVTKLYNDFSSAKKHTDRRLEIIETQIQQAGGGK